MYAEKTTQKFLDKWIKVIIPREYWPDKNPDADTPLLGVYLVSNDKMEVSRRIWDSVSEVADDISNDLHMLGQLVNVGDLLKLVGKSSGKLDGKYTIRLNCEQSPASALFSLAHEIGHLKGELEDTEKHDKDPDGYADAYAFDRIKKVVTDERLRSRIVYEALIVRR